MIPSAALQPPTKSGTPSRDDVNIAQRTPASVGYIVLGLGWAVEGMIGFQIQFGTVLETHFTLSFKHNEQFLMLSGTVFSHRFIGCQNH